MGDLKRRIRKEMVATEDDRLAREINDDLPEGCKDLEKVKRLIRKYKNDC